MRVNAQILAHFLLLFIYYVGHEFVGVPRFQRSVRFALL